MAVAFFDLDGTLTRCDTLIPYCMLAFLHRPMRILGMRSVLIGIIEFLRGRMGRQELKERVMVTFLGGLERYEITRLNSRLLNLCLPLITRNKMLRKARFHQQRGDKVYIISASPDIYVESIARLWKFNGVSCTILDWEGNYLTGRISGRNCRGNEKVRRIKKTFSDKELEGSFAYGNSDGDQPMLQLVSFGIKS